MSACTGNCCAVFNWTTSPEHLRRRWENVMGPLTESEARAKRDDLYIADMLVPLTANEALERFQEFGFVPATNAQFDLRVWLEEGTAYTCAHWDEWSRTCTAYADRPKMCADYPYGQPCSLDGSCTFEYDPETRNAPAGIDQFGA